jgi:hypothetical protein
MSDTGAKPFANRWLGLGPLMHSDLPQHHAARCVACQGVGSHLVPVALMGECSMPLV